ncbi:hypothetical protein G9464_18110 [Halostella sp. JP-L12]|uniref:DUF7344 domain-containing protein n=1 Tax=Halostella TaxID=1843185 RepID=UPI000EF7D5D6|nr:MULTISPECIES: hypothetical protein [Halostella]NHN49488.1 hypothetical protein [Halostella sp. JP-L12]
MPLGSATTTASLPLDDVLDCLSNERRRLTIEIIHDTDGPLSLSEVAERVAARQYGVERAALTSDQRKCVYTGLYQAHMSKLTEVDAVAFDDREKTISPAENTPALARTISRLRSQFDAG